MTCDESYINTLLSANEYLHIDDAKTDVSVALKTFKDLRAVIERCAQQHDRNNTQKLVTLKGTVPITMDESHYNIPIQMYLLKSHPVQPPFVFVRPSRGMALAQSKTIDKTGLISHSYLKEWKPPCSNTHSLLVALCESFTKQSPVYTKMKRSDSLLRSLSGVLTNRSDDGKKKKSVKAKNNKSNETKIEPTKTQELNQRNATTSPTNNGSSEDLSECSSSTRYSPEITESFEELFKRSMELRSCPVTPDRIKDARINSRKILKSSDELRSTRSNKSTNYFSDDVIRLTPSKSSGDALTSSFDTETPISSSEEAPINDFSMDDLKLSLERVEESSDELRNYETSSEVRRAIVVQKSGSQQHEESELPVGSGTRTKACPFSSVGCKVKLGDSVSNNHIEEAVHHHMNLLLIKTNSLETEIRYLEMRNTESEHKLKIKENDIKQMEKKVEESDRRAKLSEQKLNDQEKTIQISTSKLHNVQKETYQAKKKLDENEALLEKTMKELAQTREKLNESELKLSVTKEILCAQQLRQFRDFSPVNFTEHRNISEYTVNTIDTAMINNDTVMLQNKHNITPSNATNISEKRSYEKAAKPENLNVNQIFDSIEETNADLKHSPSLLEPAATSRDTSSLVAHDELF